MQVKRESLLKKKTTTASTKKKRYSIPAYVEIVAYNWRILTTYLMKEQLKVFVGTKQQHT